MSESEYRDRIANPGQYLDPTARLKQREREFFDSTERQRIRELIASDPTERARRIEYLEANPGTEDIFHVRKR